MENCESSSPFLFNKPAEYRRRVFLILAFYNLYEKVTLEVISPQRHSAPSAGNKI